MSEQMTRITDVVDLLNKVCFVQYTTGWSSTSLAKDAVREITSLRQLLSEAEKRESETLTQLSELAKKEAEELMDKWISDQGATAATKAAGVASHVINDFRGHIEAALIKLERRAALERSGHDQNR
jgi:Glu-tRNA(Gln) amidotransferase subunit E-like FAD-binding protein